MLERLLKALEKAQDALDVRLGNIEKLLEEILTELRTARGSGRAPLDDPDGGRRGD